MAIADVTEKNIKATEDQTSAIESLVDVSETEIVMSKDISKQAFDSLKDTEKYQQSDILDRKEMLHNQKNNLLMLERSDAREEREKKEAKRIEVTKKINDEIELSAAEEQTAVGRLANKTATGSGLLLQRLVGFETTKQRELREERREAARKKDRGTMGSMFLGKQKDKKGGLFGMLGGIGRMLGGTFSKVLGPLFKVLKLVFKVLKFTALGFALVAAGIFFSMSEADQEKTIDTVVSFFKKVGAVLSAMAKAFGGAFMKTMDDAIDPEGNPIEGLVSKFGKFKEAWGAVLKKLSGISLKVGGKTYKGLEGFASMMGDLFGKIAGWFLDLGTGIATLITDPRLIMTKMSVAISNFFGGMMDTIGRFIDEFTSMEFLLTFMPDWLRETDMAKGWIKDASESRAKEALKEMNDLAKREEVLKNREVSVQKTYDQQKAKVDAIDEKLNNDKIKLTDKERETLETERKKEDDKRINAYDMILEAKAERDRNKDRFEYAKESFEKSSEITIQNRAKEIAAKKSGVDVVKMDNQLAELDEERKKLMNEKLDQSGYNIGEFDLSEAEQIQKMLGGKTRIEKGDIDENLIRKMSTEFGIKESDLNVDQINSFLRELKFTQNKLAKNQAATAKIERDAKSKVDKFLPDAEKQARAEELKKHGVKLPEFGGKPVKQVDANKPVKVVKQPDVNKPVTPPAERPKWKEGLSDDELRKKYELSGAQKLTSKAIRNAKKKLGIGTGASVSNVEDDVTSFTGLLKGFAIDSVFDLKEQKEAFGIIEKSMEKEDLRNVLWSSGLVGMIPKTGVKGTAAGAQQAWEKKVRQLQQGGLVTETGLAMLHGTVPKPELVLDNQAAALFMKAADKLSGIQLMNLQRDKSAGLGEQKVGAAINVINNNSSQQINQNQAMILPASPISPFNSESPNTLS